MSNPYLYNLKVSNPNLRNNIPQLKSGAEQTPFFFGGSQIPTDLFLSKKIYNGSSGSGFHPNLMNELEQSKNIVDKVFHKKNHNIKLAHTIPFMK